MITVANIHLWDKRIGAVVWQPEKAYALFQFDASIYNTPWDIAPIMMPKWGNRNTIFSFSDLAQSPTFMGLPGLLADILPDKYGNALMNAWLARQGRVSDSLNPVEKLCFIGNRGIGALTFEPASPQDSSMASAIELNGLVSIVNEILGKKKTFKTSLSKKRDKALMDILKIGTSAGGARAKALIAYNSKSGEVLSGQTNAPEGFNHYILKLDGVEDEQLGVSHSYGRVEMAYYLMAKSAGIEMMDSFLLEENNRAHFVTKRFDRLANNERLHMQSFCAMRHFDFNLVGSYSYDQLFETMRMLRLNYAEAEQMFKRMVFNVLARNCDDHTKNFAFLMNKQGLWSLAPAYDVCYAYRPDSVWVSKQSMLVNLKRENIEEADFLAVAKNMNIKHAKQLIEEVKQAISQWPLYADQASVDKALKKTIAKNLLVK